MKFEKDVFISYSHIDNGTPDADTKGWRDQSTNPATLYETDLVLKRAKASKKITTADPPSSIGIVKFDEHASTEVAWFTARSVCVHKNSEKLVALRETAGNAV